MKIAFVCGFAWEPKGTARARAFPLAVELVHRGHEVTLFLTPYDNPSESGRQRVLEGVCIKNVEVGKNPSLCCVPFIAKRLCCSIKQYSPDVVHIFKPKGYAAAACSWLLTMGRRSVVLDCDDWEGWGGWNEVKDYPWFIKEYIDRQEAWLMRRAPVVTTASRELQRRVIELRQSSEDVLWIPNCGASRLNVIAQRKALSMTGDEAKKCFGLPDTPVIFYSGHFELGDDIMFFCRTASRVALQFSATIVFVGEGPNLPQVRQFFADRRGVEVRFFPRLSYETFTRLLVAADVVAFPYPDGFVYRSKCSARIVDYMSMGKAVLTTCVGENTEYIRNGESGILTPPGDEIAFEQELERLLRNSQFGEYLGRNACQRIKDKFSWDRGPVEKCLFAYQKVIQSEALSK